MKKIMAILLALILGLMALPVSANEEPVQIHTVEDLLAMAENPGDNYILMDDLDMTDVTWTCPDFSGTFDGNGHAILNLYLSQPGKETALSYDGNKKTYDTYYVGLFGTLRDATVKNLKLINVWGLVDIDKPCFLAGIAGYAENSTISGCTVTGCLELRAFDRQFGVAGVVGYGYGTVENCTVDVTLINTDTDEKTKDEQFMGGIYGTGFMNVLNCQVIIDGYISDHGYVHSGGLVGMHMQYPWGTEVDGTVDGNHVVGKITFFEHNNDRRAYCAAWVGEALTSRSFYGTNTKEFQRDERRTYNIELRPEMCEQPMYSETVTEPSCNTYGYTTYRCNSCGYTYTDYYTKFVHTVTTWTVKEEPTTEKEGLSVANCDLCGLEFQRTEEKLEPVPTTLPPETQAPTTAPEAEPQVQETDNSQALYIMIALFMTAIALLVLLIAVMRQGKRR